jgi:hypothetical protein
VSSGLNDIFAIEARNLRLNSLACNTRNPQSATNGPTDSESSQNGCDNFKCADADVWSG